MAELTYTTRGVRQRGQKDSWEITFSHKDPITGADQIGRASCRERV